MAEQVHEPARWLRDFSRFLPLKSQFVLSGNVRDLQVVEVVPGMVTSQTLNQTLGNALRQAGCAHAFLYQPLQGFSTITAAGDSPAEGEALLSQFGLTVANGVAPAGPDVLGATLERLVNHQEAPCALVIDFASRLLARNTDLTPAENQLFTRALMLSHQARSRPAGSDRRPFFNSIIWVVEREGDLPDWFLIGNPRIRHIPVSRPDHVSRRALAPALLRPLAGFAQASAAVQRAAQNAFVEGTEGMGNPPEIHSSKK